MYEFSFLKLSSLFYLNINEHMCDDCNTIKTKVSIYDRIAVFKHDFLTFLSVHVENFYLKYTRKVY